VEVKLSRRQVQLLNYIRQYITRKGFSPSLGEIGAAFGLRSPSTIHEHLEPLFKAGVLKRERGAKIFEVVDKQIAVLPETVTIPIMGFVALGQALIPNPKEESMIVPVTEVPQDRNLFCLRVRGRGFVTEGLLDGDYLILGQAMEVFDGATAVALLNNGTAVVKKVYREETRARLMSIVSDDPPIFVKRAKIQGEVLMVIRKLSLL